VAGACYESVPWLVLLRSASPSARLFAAAVPLLNMLRLLSVGLGFVKDDGLVGSVSRSGDRQELLKVGACPSEERTC
jgi:hypothetical protein